MRKFTIILITGLACMLAGRSMAQPMFGVRGGISSAWHSGTGLKESGSNILLGEYDRKQKTVVLPDAGIFVLLPVVRNMLAVQIGLDYYGAGTMETVKTKSLLGSITVERTLKLNYVSVPILLRFAYAREAMRIYAVGGGYASYAMSGREKTVGPLTDEDVNVDFGIHGVTHLDYGAILGLGVMFRTGPVWLGAELRYRKGLCNLNRNTDENEGPTKDDFAPMTNTLSPTIVLHIPLGKEKY